MTITERKALVAAIPEDRDGGKGMSHYTIQYVCSYCGNRADEQGDADLHVARCPWNQESRTCLTCARAECKIGATYWEKNVGLRTNCKRWRGA